MLSGSTYPPGGSIDFTLRLLLPTSGSDGSTVSGVGGRRPVNVVLERLITSLVYSVGRVLYPRRHQPPGTSFRRQQRGVQIPRGVKCTNKVRVPYCI